MPKNPKEDRELIRLKIVSIKTHFGFTTKKTCELLGGMNANVFKLKRNINAERNHFKESDLSLLKSNIKKLNQEYKLLKH